MNSYEILRDKVLNYFFQTIFIGDETSLYQCSDVAVPNLLTAPGTCDPVGPSNVVVCGKLEVIALNVQCDFFINLKLLASLTHWRGEFNIIMNYLMVLKTNYALKPGFPNYFIF